MIIRPPRARYDVKAFGPNSFHLDGVRVSREDIQIRTPRGLLLQCSHYRPEPDADRDPELPLPTTPVVVYLHGNASSRLEALQILRPLLVQRIAVFCYDSAGCGLSEGEYVSLGWFEREDLAAVIEHLRRSPLCSDVGIWGRSMGAATALLHCDRDPSIAAICADSSFASLPDLMQDVAHGDYNPVLTPDWLSKMLLAVVKMRVKTLAGFDTDNVVPLDHVRGSTIPALFIHAREDRFIPVEHTRRLFAEYAGDKEVMEVPGHHNSMRGRVVVGQVVAFFCKAFRREVRALYMTPRSPFSEINNIMNGQSGERKRMRARRSSAPLASTGLSKVARSPRSSSRGDQSYRSGDPSPHSAHSYREWHPSPTTPKTPPPLPAPPLVEKHGEVCTPPAVVMSGRVLHRAASLTRESCGPIRRSRRRNGPQLGKENKPKLQLDCLDDSNDLEGPGIMDIHPSPTTCGFLSASLREHSPCSEEFPENCYVYLSPRPCIQIKERGSMVADTQVPERQDVYPSLSPSLLSPRSLLGPPLLGKCSNMESNDRSGFTDAVFGNCLDPRHCSI